MSYKNPIPTVDIIILSKDKQAVILIKRKNPPLGYALPGGFLDYGESLENAAIREALEETSLKVELLCQFHTYSDPNRDPRQHTISTVFIAQIIGEQTPKGADDALSASWFSLDNLPKLAFDHKKILDDFKNKYLKA